MSASRARWKILAGAIVADKNKRTASSGDASGSAPSSETGDVEAVSVRRFASFDLFQVQKQPSGSLVYSLSHPQTSITIHHPSSFLKGNAADILMGFNNTGNVCVWPSEEVLAYYCMEHSEVFSGKTVCEIGSGYSALAALVLATCSDAASIVATDGNDASVKDIAALNVDFNRDRFKVGSVSAAMLRWEAGAAAKAGLHSFDYVLCADCLFFEECHAALCATLCELLSQTGTVLSFAPTRGHTLDNFVRAAQAFFDIERVDSYNARVTRLVEQLEQVGSPDGASAATKPFDRNLHLPVMLVMRRKRDTALGQS